MTVHDATTPSPDTFVQAGSGVWQLEHTGRGCQRNFPQAPQR
jgi:hypothetical protein